MTDCHDAEQFIVGSILRSTRVYIDPLDFHHEGCRIAYVTGSVLLNRGYFYRPVDGSPASHRDATEANIAMTATAMRQVDNWRLTSDPVWFLAECVATSTLPELVNHFADQVRQAAQQRRLADQLDFAQRLVARGELDAVQRLLREVSA